MPLRTLSCSELPTICLDELWQIILNQPEAVGCGVPREQDDAISRHSGTLGETARAVSPVVGSKYGHHGVEGAIRERQSLRSSAHGGSRYVGPLGNHD